MITAAISFIVGIFLIVLGFIIKGAIAYFGKKGAEHVYENKDEYLEKGKGYWERRKGRKE